LIIHSNLAFCNAQLQETLHLLTTHFANERLKSATGELYSKYNVYIGPLVGLYGMVSHALVVGTLQSYRGMLANKSKYDFIKIIYGSR
jgi:hypothetical protein